MADFFEIDLIDVETSKSGDAISLRYEVGGLTYIHVVDAGYQDTGRVMADHIRKYYGNPTYIDHVIATHNDGDHAGGLRAILDEFDVGALWMLRPWVYASELLPRFSRFTSAEGLRARLREIYPNLAALETVAVAKRVPILEPFQGKSIGAFTVLAPSRPRFLDLVVASERTPQVSSAERAGMFSGVGALLERAATKVVDYVSSGWGLEIFSPDGTAAENEMSVVQFANLNGERILLTGDTGRDGLTEAADFLTRAGVALPGIDRFQVPHHGSRRNVSTPVLDRWLGPRSPTPIVPGRETFSALISSAKADKDHPRKSVIRAMIHRGGKVITTEEGSKWSYSSPAPARLGWAPVAGEPYPSEQER